MDKLKLQRMIGACLMIVLAAFGCVIMLQIVSHFNPPSQKKCTMQMCLKKVLEGPPAFNDRYMTNFLQEKFFFSPSGKALSLTNINQYTKEESYFKTKEFVNMYFANMTGGRFLVVGAGDGEFMDLTLDLEKEKKWTGLLIEPNPILSKQILSKNRNAEVAKACVSPFTHPTMAKMSYPAFLDGTDEYEKLIRYRETKLDQLWDKNVQLESFKIQCIPLTNIIYAAKTLGGEKINLMVLDMAGTDLDILLSTDVKSLPPVDMIVVVAHKEGVGSEISSFFMEINMVVTRAFGTVEQQMRYILTPYSATGIGGEN